MVFELDQGPHLHDLRIAANNKGPTGDMAREILAECPDLTPYEQVFWKAFGDLSTTRQSGMTTGPIPWNMIVEYARFEELGRTSTTILLRVIRNMDSAFLNAIRKNDPDPNK